MPFSTLQEAPLRLHPWSRVTNLGNAVMFESNRAEYGEGIGYSSPEATKFNGSRGEERELGRFWALFDGGLTSLLLSPCRQCH